MDNSPPTAASPLIDVSLSTLMRQRTEVLHRRAERSGVIAAILAGTVSRRAYALYLRNLLPAYETMEAGLRRHGESPGIGALAHQNPPRTDSLIADLDCLEGTGWRRTLPLLPRGQRYADRVAAAADSPNGDLLLAHAYTRVLGDLNGGRILRRRLLQRFGSAFQAVAFTAFPGIPDLPAFAKSYRTALDEAGRRVVNREAVVREAEHAFLLNIEVAEDVMSESEA